MELIQAEGCSVHRERVGGLWRGELNLELVAVVHDRRRHGVGVVDGQHRAQVGGRSGEIHGRLEWQVPGRRDRIPREWSHRTVCRVIVAGQIAPGVGCGIQRTGGRNVGKRRRRLDEPVGRDLAHHVSHRCGDLELVLPLVARLHRLEHHAVGVDQLQAHVLQRPTRPILGHIPGDRADDRRPPSTHGGRDGRPTLRSAPSGSPAPRNPALPIDGGRFSVERRFARQGISRPCSWLLESGKGIDQIERGANALAARAQIHPPRPPTAGIRLQIKLQAHGLVPPLTTARSLPLTGRAGAELRIPHFSADCRPDGTKRGGMGGV